MARTLHVEGYDSLQKVLQDNQGQTIFVLFTGSKGPDGKSWCPDCVKADPVIEECTKFAPPSSLVVFCGVGERAFWKDQSNIFRQKLGIKSVPTLMKWGKGQKLEDADCSEKGLVQMLFED
jgi:thiol-disulfide isomerase/thioredoxin